MTMLKRRNIFALLFAVLLALPMMAILGRVVYTQSNKNAKDSYSGNVEYTETTATPVFPTNDINSVDDLVVGNYYLFQFTTEYTNESDSIALLEDIGIESFYFTFLDINGIEQYSLQHNGLYLDYLEIKTKVNSDNDNAIFIGDDVEDIYELQLFTALHSGGTCNTRFLVHYTNYIDPLMHNITDFVDFLTILPNVYQQYIISENVVEVSTLDNAFEYSVNQFIENNNFGKLNFLQWFESMFFENNQKASLYIRFANWYMNYALLLSLIYILFLVLMWFINFVRKLLEKGMNFGEGSY